MSFELRSFIKSLLNLREGAEAKHTIIDNVKDDADISSARVWTLMCAIGLASVGLNINSVPVVIGAMLISPLMGPIVSMGLALAIYDWGLLRRSARNLFILTAVSIIVSALYFLLSPITIAQSELLARTNPTIFDVLIAIFGGVAGFIGISRAKHGNIIPGVAIATALIPPLCTVGYGIGTWQPVFIFGALYLFVINCIFICLSSLIVAKYLKLPKREYLDEVHRHRVSRFISVLTIIIIVPAVYLAYTFVNESNFNSNVDRYTASVFTDAGHIVVYEKRAYHRTGNTLEVAFLDEQFSDVEINTYRERLKDFDLEGTILSIRQNGAMPAAAEWDSLIGELTGKEAAVALLQSRLEAERNSANSPIQLLAEAKAIDSSVVNLSLETLASTDGIGVPIQTTVTIYHDAEDLLTIDITNSLTTWLRTRLKDENLQVIFTPLLSDSSVNLSPTIDTE